MTDKKSTRRAPAKKRTSAAKKEPAKGVRPPVVQQQPKSMTLEHWAQMMTEVRTAAEVEQQAKALRDTGSKMITHTVTLVLRGDSVTWKVEIFGHVWNLSHSPSSSVILSDLDGLMSVEVPELFSDSTSAIGRALLNLSNVLTEAWTERDNLAAHLATLHHWDRDRLFKIFEGHA